MKTLYITDERMLLLMNYAVNEMELASSYDDYLRMIDFVHTNISNVRQGRQGFSKQHIENACKLTGASADYIFGFTKTIMRKESRDPLKMIKEAVRVLEKKK